MTGSLSLRILPTDSSFAWGCALLRLVPPEQAQKEGALISILRVLAANPQVRARALTLLRAGWQRCLRRGCRPLPRRPASRGMRARALPPDPFFPPRSLRPTLSIHSPWPLPWRPPPCLRHGPSPAAGGGVDAQV